MLSQHIDGFNVVFFLSHSKHILGILSLTLLLLSVNTFYPGYRSQLVLFQCGDRLYASESDVYRRQILTYKDGLRE